MPELAQLVVFLLFGLLSGLIGGLLGVGGGTVYVPVLTAYYAAYSGQNNEFVVFVIGNSLFLTLISGLSGSWKQFRSKNFYLREVLLVGGGGAATALATTIFLQGATWYKREQFALFFTILLIPLIVRLLLKREPKDLKGGAIVSPWKLVVVESSAELFQP